MVSKIITTYVLKYLLEGFVDFERPREQPAVKLFLCATNVRTGKLKVFAGRKLPQTTC